MWNEEITLLSSSDFTEDELGQQIPTTTETVVLGYEKPMNRAEFYQAGQSGIEVAYTLAIHPFEYRGEQNLIYQGQQLSVVRHYKVNNETLELVCRLKVGDTNG